MRPSVLVATTHSAMAYALNLTLEEPCRKLGLRLDICPGGELDSRFGERCYDSAEALFDHLEQRSPMELADTLVVLYTGAEDLADAFRSRVPGRTTGWNVTDNCAGVAVELLLRFPQVFPLFLSVAVPTAPPREAGSRYEVVEPELIPSEADDGRCSTFRELISDLTITHKANSSSQDVNCFDKLCAFAVPLHFISPLDNGKGLYSALARFARGMRCWFDPTGLRTLVKNRFLGTLFGSQADWSNTREQRNVLLERLPHVAVAIDEEREFALLNAYAAYKFGRRAWLVTTFAEFDDKPLWVANSSTDNTLTDVVVIRDIDLRFPDIPNQDRSESRDTQKALRDQLSSIHSDVWKMCFDGQPRLRSGWRVRVVTSQANVAECSPCTGTQGDGEMTDGRLCGLGKPISSLYEIKRLLANVSTGCKAESIASVASRITPAGEKSSGVHGAPYLNLAMAESLLHQSGRYEHGPVENLLGAFLAGEAYELLLGMSETTALEALLMQHKHEVVAEGEFPGISHEADIDKRGSDVEVTVEALLSLNRSRRQKESITDLFLVKFWTELKLAYRSSEQFNAAEAANAKSLVHTDWLASFSESLRSVSAAMPICWRRWIKNRLVHIATSFRSWAEASLMSVLLATLAYALVSNNNWTRVGELFLSTMLSSITLQPMTIVSDILSQQCSDVEHVVEHIVAVMHMAVSYLLFGVLISMLYRKVTRG